MAVDAPPAPTKGERTRRRILDAAERVFGEKGYHAASIADITREAEVAMGTFYVYFPSKRDALVELVRTTGHEMRAELAGATAGLSARAEIERAGITAFLRWVGRHPDIYRVVRNAEFADRTVYEEWYRKLGEEYARGLRAAMDAGEIAASHPEALAFCLMGAIDYAGMRWVLWEPDAGPDDEVLNAVVEFVVRGLGTGGAGHRTDGRRRTALGRRAARS